MSAITSTGIAAHRNALLSQSSTSILAVVMPVFVALVVAIIMVGTGHVSAESIATAL